MFENARLGATNIPVRPMPPLFEPWEKHEKNLLAVFRNLIISTYTLTLFKLTKLLQLNLILACGQ